MHRQKERSRSDLPPLSRMRGKVSHLLGTIYELAVFMHSKDLQLGLNFIICFTLLS